MTIPDVSDKGPASFPLVTHMTMKDFTFHKPTAVFASAFYQFQVELTDLLIHKFRCMDTDLRNAQARCMKLMQQLFDLIKQGIQPHVLEKISKISWIFTEVEVWERDIDEATMESSTRHALKQGLPKLIQDINRVVHPERVVDEHHSRHLGARALMLCPLEGSVS